MRDYLRRTFEATEEVNRQAILCACTPRPGATLLDLGCAGGAVTMRVAERVGAGRVIGAELVEHLAAAAEERGIEVLRADLGRPLPLGDASVDVVHSNQVIEHLQATDLFMREIRRVLRPDGYAVVSTNNLSSLHNIVSLALGLQPTPCHVSDEVIGLGNPANFARGAGGAAGQMHLRIFTAKALAELAEHHGLRVDLARTAGFYPLPPRAARVATRVARPYGAFLVQRYVPAS
jgi:SAM-dependent methyltransferase